MRITRGWILALLVALLGAGCQDQRNKEISEIREAERGVRPFDPAALHDSTRQHVALKFQIVQDSLGYQPDSVFLRPGRMPYRPPGAGGFAVAFRDSADHPLESLSYTMEDPRLLRSCDFSQGRPGGTTLRSSGQVEILAPADPRIASIILRNASGKVQHFPIGARFKLVVQP